MRRLTIFIIVVLLGKLYAQTISRIDPPYWFTGMANPKVQLLVYGENIADYNQVTVKEKGIAIDKITTVKNSNYLFIDLIIESQVKATTCKIIFSNGKKCLEYAYELKAKQGMPGGINSSDLIYLMMPDRFSNGDTLNDKIPLMLDQTLNNDSMFYRHGGDLQGIINHLDYLYKLGVSTLWLNPVIENNQAKASYHGYAYTDHYKIDPRLGTNFTYVEFVQKSHQKKLKVIQDMVYNHVGSEHWFIKDLPDTDWVHYADWQKSNSYSQTNYRATTLLDPYASAYDKNKMMNGWFDKHMPDLNQQNPLLATYLIQNSIWWIESAGIDGYRIDTYAYCDRKFMSALNDAILIEYPRFGIFGEIWDHGTAIQAFFADGYHDSLNVATHLPGITDFQLYYSLNAALAEPFGWTEGLNKIYYTLCQDYLYKNPDRNVIFLDNHDVSRFYSVVHEDFDLFKMGIGFLLTTRGIPMLYYGTEILMKNFADPDGKVREDFDPASLMLGHPVGDREKEAFEYIKKLANYRKENAVLQTGKLMQFVPEDGIYVYFRYNAEKSIMIIMNTNKEDKQISADRFNEMLQGFSKGYDIFTNQELDQLNMFSCRAKNIQIIELR